MVPSPAPPFRRACALLGLVVALCAGSAARAGPEPGPRLRISSRGPVRPGDRVEFVFDGERRGVDEFEILLSTDGGKSYPMRISEPLSPATRRLLWRVPRLPCKEIRLRVQFHRDGREIEGEETAPVLLLGDDGDGSGIPMPLAVETEGPPLPSRGRGSPRASGSESDAEENTECERRGPLEPSRITPPDVVPASASLPRSACRAPSGLGSAPEFVPPRE